MKNIFIKPILGLITVFSMSIFLFSCSSESPNKFKEFSDYPIYTGNDLGVIYSETNTSFKLWSPNAEYVTVRIYENGVGGDAIFEYNLDKSKEGVWSKTSEDNLKNKYYTFQAKFNGKWNSEEADPYAKAVGVNGKRGMIVDMQNTNPVGWSDDKRPYLKGFEDIILYELQVRDVSISNNSGIKNKGKFIGLVEEGSKNNEGLSTGIDHIKELGVTHVHLLPAFDFRSIDETKPELNKYNWGYDPQNYNVPEGSYSTNPYDGNVRIKEFKEMVQAYHKAGIRVVLDVVYNHTGFTHDSNLDQLVPGYYYRQWDNGSFSDASACGNETASDREMTRKFIVESVVYWAEEYHLDGFRFDLMGIHDIETMNDLDKAVKKVDPTIFVYGEGWTAGDSPLAIEDRAIKANASKLNTVAVFSDDIRDGIKGSWNSEHSKGYVSGNTDLKEDVKFGIVASTVNSQVNLKKVSYVDEAYSKSPLQTISYVSCHDNHTLFDKLKVSNTGASDQELIRLSKLSNTIVMTSQGIPFLHAGVEMARSKQGVENSYESPDSINEIDWSLKTKNIELVKYYQDLIKLRKQHSAFKMTSTKQIQENLKFDDVKDDEIISYTIDGQKADDKWREIKVIINVSEGSKSINVGTHWRVALDGDNFFLNGKSNPTIYKNKNIEVPRKSVVILFKDYL